MLVCDNEHPQDVFKGWAMRRSEGWKSPSGVQRQSSSVGPWGEMTTFSQNDA